MSLKFSRRSMLRGALGGAAVCVGVPTLDCFLNDSGTAFAADGAKIPTRFGTYFFGLGLTPILANGKSRWVPTKEGKDWEITPELETFRDIKGKVSVMSGFKVHLDGRPNVQHHSGHAAILAGAAPTASRQFAGPSFDIAVQDQMGGGTRFRSIDCSPYGRSTSYSTRNGTDFATADITPLSLYTRLFGEGFQDPNSDSFTPDPQVMLRKSVLSAVTDQRQSLLAQVGAEDRIRLDQYFTSVRQMEEQLAYELEKPAKCESCVVPTKPEELPRSREIGVVNRNSKLMAELIAMGLACNQTKIVNFVHSDAGSSVYLPGDSSVYHLHTHDEAVDDVLGYQPVSSKLAMHTIQAFGDFLRALDAIKEGDGTLLDHSLIMGFSDTGYAKIHGLDNIPMFLAGGANGAHKPGHVMGKGDPVSRVSLTAQQLIGMPVGNFGQGGMRTNKTISEVVA